MTNNPASSDGYAFGLSHLSDNSIVLAYGIVILAALGLLCLLRQAFGAIRSGT